MAEHNDIPTIDMSSLFVAAVTNGGEEVLKRKREVGEKIRNACETSGFFRIVGHGLSVEELQSLLKRSQEFFTQLPADKKMELAPKKWRQESTNEYRGYFPASVNGKEGLDLGTTLSFTPLFLLSNCYVDRVVHVINDERMCSQNSEPDI